MQQAENPRDNFGTPNESRGQQVPTIIKRGERWQARVRRRGYPPQSDTFRTRAAAERWARDVEAKMDAGSFEATSTEARRLTLAEALERYATTVTPKKRGRVRELQRVDFWKAHKLASRPLAAIKPTDVAEHRDQRTAAGLGANSVRLELALLSHVFTVARKDWGMAGLVNPVKETTKPRLVGTERDRRLQPGEEARLLRACRAVGPAWLVHVVVLAIETAMRRGEMARLTADRIRGPIADLGLTKNGARRRAPLSPRALVALRRIRRVLGDRMAMPAASTITHAFTAAAKAAGLQDLHFHDLRHEATSRLFELGLNIAEVAAITGHKTWSQLARYTHPKAEDLAAKLAKKSPPGREALAGRRAARPGDSGP